MATTTANMSLEIPEVDDTDYPSSIETSLEAIDSHDHSSGKGVQIPTSGIANSAVTTTKIATDAVTTTKIQDDAVTAAKIADGAIDAAAKLASNVVTQAKLESRPTAATATAGQIALSSSAEAGTYSPSAGTSSSVTNLTCTLTTTGRPVRVELIAVNSEGVISISRTTATDATVGFSLYEGANLLTGTAISVTGASGNIGLQISPSQISFWHFAAAGTYTYQIKVSTGAFSTPASTQFSNVKLLAYEI